jgi:hypothetical protein
LLALEILLVEAAMVSRNRFMQRVAMTVLPGVLLLAVVGHRANPVSQGFLDLFRQGLGGSPLFLALVAVPGLYGFAAVRRVPLALGALTSSLLALSVVGPATLNLGGLVAPQPLPLLAVAFLQLGLAMRRQESWRSLIGFACLVVAITTGLGSFGLEGHRGFVAFHLTVVSAILIGAWFQDPLARFLQRAAALLLGLSSLAALSDWGILEGVPRDLLRVYPLLVILSAALYGYLSGCRPFLAAAAVGLVGWLASVGWRSYFDLRRGVVGLDWIASGLAFFAVAAGISLIKTGLPARWWNRHDEVGNRPLGTFES